MMHSQPANREFTSLEAASFDALAKLMNPYLEGIKTIPSLLILPLHTIHFYFREHVRYEVHSQRLLFFIHAQTYVYPSISECWINFVRCIVNVLPSRCRFLDMGSESSPFTLPLVPLHLLTWSTTSSMLREVFFYVTIPWVQHYLLRSDASIPNITAAPCCSPTCANPSSN